jgi:SAM-dependent methyltransferase
LRHVLALHLDLRQATVLDVGSGTGFWVDVWKSLGPKTVTASDVTQCAANQLRQRHPEIRVVRLDISSHDATQTLGTHYEIISAMDVLFHITCDEDFATAIANLSRLLRPRGFLVFSDNMLQRERPATATQANRTLETVQKHLSRNGLQIIRRAPMFFMMNAPIDVSSDAVRGLWRTMMAPLRRFPALGSLYGAALFPLDLVLTQIVSQSPSTELVICQKFTR